MVGGRDPCGYYLVGRAGYDFVGYDLVGYDFVWLRVYVVTKWPDTDVLHPSLLQAIQADLSGLITVCGGAPATGVGQGWSCPSKYIVT